MHPGQRFSLSWVGLEVGSAATARVTRAMAEIKFDVDGFPPAKGEALSMLGQHHSHAPRVLRLLEAARDAAAQAETPHFGSLRIGLELVLRCRRDRNRGDATNYLGGLGDVLEGKAHRGQLEHLGEFARVALYENDRQIEQLRYRWEDAVEPSYTVRVWELDA